MIVVVTGGRNFGVRRPEWEFIHKELDARKGAMEVLVHGGARGVDSVANHWALANAVPHLCVPARWRELGFGAGPERNRRMLLMAMKMMGPSNALLLVFPGGKGTEDCHAQAIEILMGFVDLRPGWKTNGEDGRQ